MVVMVVDRNMMGGEVRSDVAVDILNENIKHETCVVIYILLLTYTLYFIILLV